jgi:hypothetical protein
MIWIFRQPLPDGLFMIFQKLFSLLSQLLSILGYLPPYLLTLNMTFLPKLQLKFIYSPSVFPESMIDHSLTSESPLCILLLSSLVLCFILFHSVSSIYELILSCP